jgi:hypothetical protein
MATRTVGLVVSLLAFSAVVNADTILQVSGPIDFSVFTGNPDPFGNLIYSVASWTQTTEYEGVSISFLGNGVSSPATGTAYLTTSMGLGTTMADQIASTTFSAPAGPTSPISLFSGLSLPANTYYLTIFADAGSQIEWAATNSPITTLGDGVGLNFSAAVGENLLPFGSFDPYPPATEPFFGFQDNLLLDVSSVPEPSTLSLLAVCCLAAVFLRPFSATKRIE